MITMMIMRIIMIIVMIIIIMITSCASGRARAVATSAGVFGEARKMKVDSKSNLKFGFRIFRF